MARSVPIPKKILEYYYLKRGLSMKKISETLNCGEHKIVYWMKAYRIRRRSRSDAAYLQFNPNGDPFSIKESMTPNEKLLFGLGLGIYWGEGNKANHHTVAVANSNPEIIIAFRRFLFTICQANEDKVLYSIVCFNDVGAESAKRYWAKQLKIPPKKFGKIVQVPSRGEGTYRKKSRYGVCTISFGNVRLKRWIMQELENLVKKPG